MDSQHDTYQSPLAGRYASRGMRELFSDRRKFTTWRRLWVILAQQQQRLGLPITDEQVAQMQAHVEDIDYDQAAQYEKTFRHDVMAHIHAFGDVAPAARPIIHLGATSQYVNDNADLIIMREALGMLALGLANVIDQIGQFAAKWRDLPCLAFTHFQPAQLTTVGKRAALWCYDFIQDLRDIEHRREGLEFRGVKGATGTQASFLALFEGDHAKVRELDRAVAAACGFERLAPVTGQTYSRKVDAAVAQALAGVGASVHKLCNDIRLLAHRKELEEPFEPTQVGSSAMAYKRNPMRCERATGVARFLMDVAQSPLHTAAEQWLERTLDDSSNKRLAMAEAFLAADAVVGLTLNIVSGLVVYPATIAAGVAAELPFMATENILMAAVKCGGDRQDVHERIRQHSQAAAARVKAEGKPNDLLDCLKADAAFADLDIEALVKPAEFIGRAPQQVDEFLADQVEPIRRRYAGKLGLKVDLAV